MKKSTKRDFNVGDKILCKKGLTTRTPDNDIQIFYEGDYYQVKALRNTRKSIEYDIISSIKKMNPHPVVFHQLLGAVVEPHYVVHEFFYTIPEERAIKMKKIQNYTGDPEPNYFQKNS